MSGRRVVLVVLLIACLLVVALGVWLAWGAYVFSQQTHAAAVTVLTPTVPAHGACHSLNGLPDPTCTPGVADPRVTQQDILSTICVSGYTARVRPPSSYTNMLKREQIKQYGYTDTNLADYEEDHLIPLELGGHPTNPENLWPEPLSGADPATKKDGVENSLHSRVCAGLMTLAAAQTAIAKNWESI